MRQVAGRYDQEKVTAKGLRGTSLLHHTLSLRAKLRSAVPRAAFGSLKDSGTA